MTQNILFQPTIDSAFSFQASLDGATYTNVITWNIAGQRWYLNIYDKNQTLILCIAMTGSTTDLDVNLLEGYFENSTLSWVPRTNQIVIGP